ncbi:MAG: branched-chain amino acid ABC transporter permease [Chloroflexi bacterium]|nr:branched-chain amino acid ABC transporter permease [Chloroflexota bacterium]
MAGDGGAVERSTTGRSHLDARQRVDAVQGRHSTRRANAVAIVAFSAFIALMGWIEIARPLGIRFADLTGGVVTMDTMVRIGILTIVVVGLNLLMGYAGQASMGQAAFYAIGAYGSAILTAKARTIGLPDSIAGAWWWPWLVIVCNMALAAGFTYLVGKPILRLRGHYLAMGTLGLGIVVYIFLRENFGLSTANLNLTGGMDGIPDVGRLAIGSFTLWPIERYYILVWVLVLGVIVLSLNIVDSRVGRALRSIHGSEVAANTIGVDTDMVKLQVLVLSAVYASLAGSLYAHFQAAVSPGPFSFGASLELIVMSVIGGIASIWGAPFGVAVTLILKELIRTRMHTVLRGAGGEHEVIAFGTLIVIIMLFLPDGLTVGGVNMIKGWIRERTGSGGRAMLHWTGDTAITRDQG